MKKKSIYTEEQKKLTEKIITARKEANLSQKQVAENLGTSQSYVSKIEAGQLRVDIIQLKELSKLYNKTIDYFF